MTTRIKVIQGGQGAGKNYSVAQILLEKAAEKKRIITVMSDTYDNLKDGAILDFQHVFDDMERYDWSTLYNSSSHDLKYYDSVIQFRYINDKRSSGKSKRRDILYLNEANKFGWNVAFTYIGRTHEDIYIDHNPDREYWAHTEVPKLVDEHGKPESSQIIVTYIDNEMLPLSEVRSIESRRNNVEWFRVYGLGITGTYSERQIYNYDIVNEIPSTAKRIASGMDFGKSPDKTTLIDLYIDNADLYIQERFALNNLEYEKIRGSERMSIVDQMELINFPKGQPIIADSAGRTAILDLRKHGYNIRGVKKRQGRIIDAINKVRGYFLHVLPNSPTIKEDLDGFFWKEDKNGKVVPEVEGHEPDTLVSIRYVIMTIKN